jgi:hypothetical protein
VTGREKLPPTKVFANAGLDESKISRKNPNSGSDITFDFELQILTSSKHFHSSAVMVGRISNPPADSKSCSLGEILGHSFN